MNKLQTTQDLDQIYEIAHTIKGSAAQIGAMQFSHVASQLEQAVTNRTDEIEELVKRLKPSWDSARDAIREYISKN